MAEKRPDRILGPAHNDFWTYCNKGEFRLQRCNKCGEISWPAVTACEHCGATDLTWEQLSGRGKVISWTTHERPYYGELIPIPWDAILVELEEGPLFLSNPKGFTWKETQGYMPVKLAFIDCEDSTGPFRLPVFEKA